MLYNLRYYVVEGIQILYLTLLSYCNFLVNKIGLIAATDRVEQAARCFIESAQEYGLKFQEQSGIYQNRPPKQNESRIYLTFTDRESSHEIVYKYSEQEVNNV